MSSSSSSVKMSSSSSSVEMSSSSSSVEMSSSSSSVEMSGSDSDSEAQEMFDYEFRQNPLATYAVADKATKKGFGNIDEIDDILGVTNSYRFYSNMLEHKSVLGTLELKYKSMGGEVGGILLDHVRREKKYFDAVTQILNDKFLMLGAKK